MRRTFILLVAAPWLAIVACRADVPDMGHQSAGSSPRLAHLGDFSAEPAFTEARSFHDGLAAVRIDGGGGGKWGYINVDGTQVVAPEFDTAGDFAHGLAPVSVAGRFGYIDRSARYVVNPQYSGCDVFAEGLAVVVDTEPGRPSGEGSPAALFRKLSGRWPPMKGYVRSNGDLAVPFQFHDARAFQQGRAAVLLDSTWGYIDDHGTLVIPPRFEEARDFADGLAAVKSGGLWGYIDLRGNFAIRPQFDQASAFGDGRAAVRVGDSAMGRWGYIAKDGAFVVNPQFDDARPFQEGVAAVRRVPSSASAQVRRQGGANDFGIFMEDEDELNSVEDSSDHESGFWGYIDTEGLFVISEQFDRARSFSEGVALVRVGAAPSGKWGFVDKTGHFVINPRFDSAASFREGRALVRMGPSQGGRWGYIQR